MKVGDINPLSDHCIIYTRLSLSTSQTTQLYPDITHMDSVYTTHIPYKWKSDAMEAFIINIASKHIQLQALQKSLDSTCITKHIVNNTVTNLSHVLREASKTCANHMKPQRNTSINSNMPWHNEQCKSLRKDFTTVMIIPIYKKGDVQSPSNYRPITLLSSIGKLFTKILSKRITEWAEDHALLTEAQFGFRPTYSTTDANYTLYSLVNSIRRKQKLYCAFIDFSTAFDSVDRDILYDCLTESGISSKMLKIIIALYSNTSSCVKLNNVCSDIFLLNRGLRHGDSLSPVLFIFYINKK